MVIGETKELSKSRYNQKRFIRKLDNNKYLIYGESHYGRTIGDDKITAIDFEGGPYISVGQSLYEVNHELYIDKFTPYKEDDIPDSNWAFTFETVDYITNEINRYQDLKENTTKKVKEYVQNKENPLEERWNIFIASELGDHLSYYEEFEGIDWGKHTLYNDFCCEKYQTIDAYDILSIIKDDLESFEDFQEDVFKEDVLSKFIYSFKNDW